MKSTTDTMTKKFSLDSDNPTPLYFQVYTSILDRIASTEFKINDPLPSERVLGKQYGVSSVTIKKALSLLKKEGIVVNKAGKGTFVTRVKLQHDPSSRATVTDYMREQGGEPEWRVLKRDWLVAPDMAALGLNLPARNKLFQAQLLLLTNQKPIGYHLVYVPVRIAQAEDLDQAPENDLLDFLRDSPTAAKCSISRIFEATLADGLVAAVLQMEVGAAVMKIDVRHTAPNGDLVQVMRSFYRGDSFRYKF